MTQVNNIRHSTLWTEIGNVFMEVQRSPQKHVQLSIQLQQLLKSDVHEFSKAASDHLSHPFMIFKKDKRVDRVFDLIAEVCSSATRKQDKKLVSHFFMDIIQFIVSVHDSSLKAVRYRSMQLVGKLLSSKHEEDPTYDFSDSQLYPLFEAILLRTKDKIASIRCLAVRACGFLQNCDDEDDEITMEMVRLMSSDPSKEVRLAALNSIGISQQSLNSIVERCKDSNDFVRCSAFKVVRSKIPMQLLSIANRVNVLFDGLSDRCPAVQNIAKSLVYEWWSLQNNSDLFSFVTKLEVELFEPKVDHIVKLLISEIIAKGKGDFHSIVSTFSLDNIVKDGSISFENVFIFRRLIESAIAENDDAAVDILVPDIIHLCMTLEKLYSGDTVLLKTSVETVKALALLFPDIRDEETCRSIVSVFQAVICDLRPSFNSASLKSIDVIVGSLCGVSRCDSLFEALSELQEHIMSDQVGDASVDLASYRWLCVSEALLRFIPVDMVGVQESIKSMFTVEGFLNGVAHADSSVRSTSIKCLCMYSIILNDEVMANSQMPILIKLIERDIPDIKRTALECCFDLLLVFNIFDRFDAIMGNTTELQDVLLTTVQGLCKLLVGGTLNSNRATEILVSLLLLVINPHLRNDDQLHQLFSVFFPNIASLPGSSDSLIIDSISAYTFAVIKNEDINQKDALQEGYRYFKLMIFRLAQISGDSRIFRDFIEKILTLFPLIGTFSKMCDFEIHRVLFDALEFFDPNHSDLPYLVPMLEKVIEYTSMERKSNHLLNSLLVDWTLKLDQSVEEGHSNIIQDGDEDGLFQFEKKILSLKSEFLNLPEEVCEDVGPIQMSENDIAHEEDADDDDPFGGLPDDVSNESESDVEFDF